MPSPIWRIAAAQSDDPGWPPLFSLFFQRKAAAGSTAPRGIPHFWQSRQPNNSGNSGWYSL